MKKTAIALALMVSATGAQAALLADSNLSITQGTGGFTEPAAGTGSWFAMEALGPGGWVYTGIGGINGINLGTSQAASGATAGEGIEAAVGNIDAAWTFFGSYGVHQTTSPMTVISDTGTGSAVLDFSGWDVSWNNVASISMGGSGTATITCANTCEDGDTYTLDYATNVPSDSANFPGVAYQLHLEGVVSAVPVPAAVWLFGSGLVGLAGIARRRKTA